MPILKNNGYDKYHSEIGPASKSIEQIKAEERKRQLAQYTRNNILAFGTPNGGKDWSDDQAISSTKSLSNSVTIPLSFTKAAPLIAASDYYRNFNDSNLGTAYDALSLGAYAINPKLAFAMNVAPIPFAINDIYQKGASIDNGLDLTGGSLAIADKTIRPLLYKRLPRKMQYNLGYGIWGQGEPIATWIKQTFAPKKSRLLLKKGRHGFDPVSKEYRKYTYSIGVLQTAPFLINLGENAKNIYDYTTEE